MSVQNVNGKWVVRPDVQLKTPQQDVRYVVTGVDRSGRRFQKIYSEPQWALGINLWRGSVWEQSPDGKRTLLRRVWN